MKIVSLYILIMINLLCPAVSFAVAAAPDNVLTFQIIQGQLTLNNSNVESAAIVNEKNGAFSGLQIQLKPAAAKKLDLLTANNIGKQINIILNKKVGLTSTIQSSTLGNSFLITGITKEEAEDFVKSLTPIAIPT